MVISLYNIKGGVGKTTTLLNLAYLTKKRFKTLIIDLDPQGASTYLLNKKLKKNLLSSPKEIEKNLFLSPGSLNPEYKNNLEEFIKNVKFDIIFIDSPAFVNTLTSDIIKVSSLILVPIIPNILSLRTYNQILNLYPNKNIKLFLNGVENTPSHKKIISSILKLPKNQFLKTYIPKSSLIENMPFTSIITKKYPFSKETKAYQKLLEEII